MIINSSLLIIDSHSHIDYGYFFEQLINDNTAIDLTEVSLQTKYIAIVAGVCRNRWRNLEKLATYKNIVPCFGIHPWYVTSHIPHDLIVLNQLIEKYSPVAIGECGLDYYLPQYPKLLQQEYLIKQLDLAVKHNLPVILHACKSYDELHKIIKSYPNISGVVHGFNGSLQQAFKWLDLGFYLGFGGAVITSNKLQNIVRQVPTDYILIESDAPEQLKGYQLTQSGYLQFLYDIASKIAIIKSTETALLIEQCNQNARRLFNLPL